MSNPILLYCYNVLNLINIFNSIHIFLINAFPVNIKLKKRLVSLKKYKDVFKNIFFDYLTNNVYF